MLINLQNPDVASQLILSSALEGVDLSNVEVRTLTSYYYEQLQIEAMEKHSHILCSIQPNYEKLERRIQEYIDDAAGETYLKQFVDFTQGGDVITIYMNVDSVDNTSWTDVISILSQLNEMVGIVEFGSPIRFGKQKTVPKILATSLGFI